MTWEFWLDKPLHIVVILVGGFVINLILRSVIRRVTDKIAGGKPNDKPEPTGHRRKLSEESEQARLRRVQRAQTVGSVLRSVTTIVIAAIVALMVLAELGFNLAPVLASAGIVGVALGFGAQTLVKDFLAGLFIVLEDQYGIGDYVSLTDAGGVDVGGMVESVGLRATHLRGTDGTLWHIGNGEILKCGNMSQGWSRTVMDIPVPYNSDIDRASELILNTAYDLRSDPEQGANILDDPEVWGVQELTGESITIRLVLRTKPLTQWAIGRALRLRLKHAFDEAGVQIPLLQQMIVRTNPKSADNIPTKTSTDSHRQVSTGPWTHGGPSDPMYEIPEG